MDGELSRVIHELDGVHRGYLNTGSTSNATANALRRLGNQLQDLKIRFHQLGCHMQSLNFPECNQRGSAERNGYYQTLDVKLNQIDSLIRGITEMIVKGEFMSGKLCSASSSGFKRTF